MTIKVFCPHCGRCLGDGISSDEKGEVKALVNKPTKLKRKQFIHDAKCIRCKNRVYISMEFPEQN